MGQASFSEKRITVDEIQKVTSEDYGLKQADLVRGALADDAVQVRSVLCFVEADWPLLGGDFVVRDVTVTWPKMPEKEANGEPITEYVVTASSGESSAASSSAIREKARSQDTGT